MARVAEAMSETPTTADAPAPPTVKKRKPRRVCEGCTKTFTPSARRPNQRFHSVQCAGKATAAERHRKAEAIRDNAHYINLWINPPGTPNGSCKFWLDNEVYVRLMAWQEKRPELWSVTSAINAMIRKTVRFDGSGTLMEAFDNWRACNGAFRGRPAAVKWIIDQMLAKG